MSFVNILCLRLTSHTTSSSREPNGQSNLGAEVGRQNRYRGDEQHAAAEANAEALSQHSLPELCAETQHHEAKDHTEAADEQEQSQVTAVKDGSGAGADEKHAY
jgi:hypothetical protein